MHIPHSPSRRSVVRATAWALPAVTLVTAAPAFAASPGDVGAYTLVGSCGVLGILGPGFTLTPGAQPLPAGTVVTITGTGVANIGVLSISGGLADVNVLSDNVRRVTLTQDLQPGQQLSMRTTLSVSVAFTLTAGSTLPEGYTATGAKTAGSVNSTLVLCSAS